MLQGLSEKNALDSENNSAIIRGIPFHLRWPSAWARLMVGVAVPGWWYKSTGENDPCSQDTEPRVSEVGTTEWARLAVSSLPPRPHGGGNEAPVCRRAGRPFGRRRRIMTSFFMGRGLLPTEVIQPSSVRYTFRLGPSNTIARCTCLGRSAQT